MKPFLELADQGGLLFDGAMGTVLYERGVFLNRCFEKVSLEQPEMVRTIHEEYLRAGARVLTTNTFGSGRFKLEKHGLVDEFEAINRASVRIARQVAGGRAYVAGSIGPTGVGLSGLAGAQGAAARQALAEQIEVLVDAGVDILLFETFEVVQELELAIRLARERCTLPVVALQMFTDAGQTTTGMSPARVGQRLVAAGADVIGSNCGVR